MLARLNTANYDLITISIFSLSLISVCLSAVFDAHTRPTNIAFDFNFCAVLWWLTRDRALLFAHEIQFNKMF